MDDMELQFDIDVPFEKDKKTKKPFPGDFSFNADGLLEDCEIEETLTEPEEEIQMEAQEEFAESFDADFEDVVEEDFDDEDFGDEDDAALWNEFCSVFEEEEVPAETVPVEEPVEAPVEDEEDDLTLSTETFQDELTEEAEPVEEPVEDVSPVFVTEDIVPDLDEGEEDDEDSFDFPEDSDTECDFVAVPKPTVSVTTWNRVRERANAAKNQNTYETEHFFAVEEDYTENAIYKSQTPAARVMGILDDAPTKEEAESEPVQPIWCVDDTDSPEDLTPEVSDEEMDYDDIFNDDRTAYRKKKKRKNLLKKILKEFALFLAIIIGALFLVTNFTIYVSRQNTVVGHSMEPTLHGGDHVYTTMLPYIFGDPEVGDIIVFDYSCHGEDMGYFHMLGEVLKNNRLIQLFKDSKDLKLDEYWIKRVVAVAGDTVSFKDNQFYRNGELVEEDFILEQTVTNYTNGEEIVVPKGQVFVMGDNRNNSTDSRMIGCIDIDIITGKVWKNG